MNIKQFVSSTLFSGVDFGVSKLPWLGFLLAVPIKIIFPKMGYEKFNNTGMSSKSFFAIYVFGVVICFGIQALLAFTSEKFLPNGDNNRLQFLEDGWNMFNYIVVVPLYLVVGTGFINSLFSLKGRMGSIAGFDVEDSGKPYLSGLLAFGAIIVILIFAQAQYAFDVQRSTKLFWFHGQEIGAPFDFGGYAYLLINAILNTFVIVVALLHLELFRWSSNIVKAIKSSANLEAASAENNFWQSDDKVKEVFAPFTETAIWSKAFAGTLAVNMYTWKESGLNTDGDNQNTLFVNVVFLLFVVLALWVVSLPRYRIQYEIFKFRRKMGIHEYKDIRMPWTIGWSVFVDVFLLAFLSTAVFGNKYEEFFRQFFSSISGP